MLDIGLSELLIILAVALIVLGPKKLPEVARSLGRGLAQFRRASEDLRRSILVDEEPFERDKSAEALPHSSAHRRSDPPSEVAEEAPRSGDEPAEPDPTPPASDVPPKRNGIDG
jgi:Tat protein translocase TatB subunit